MLISSENLSPRGDNNKRFEGIMKKIEGKKLLLKHERAN